VSAKRALSRFRAPDELAAEERAWGVVRSTYQARVPFEHPRSYRRRVAGVAAGILVVGGLALSPAGAAVGHLITRALGVQHSAPALASLPAPGRLLVSGSGGAWTVATDGALRRVGGWTEASWSPRGLYLAVARPGELAAVTPKGAIRWILHRPRVSDPLWYPQSGYRVAYRSGRDLRVVAGDGTGDHLLAGPVAPTAPAWRPGSLLYPLAYISSGGALVVRDGDTGAQVWSTKPGMAVRQLAWSADGQRLLAVSARAVAVYDSRGKLLATRAAPDGAPIVDAAISPDGHRLALVLGGPGGAVITEGVDDRNPPARRELSGSGLQQVAWSPDGRWLLVSWPVANQWVFIRVAGKPRISAVSRIAQQFSPNATSQFPRLDGWCCTAHVSAR
jgi:hypothetical protein